MHGGICGPSFEIFPQLFFSPSSLNHNHYRSIFDLTWLKQLLKHCKKGTRKHTGMTMDTMIITTVTSGPDTYLALTTRSLLGSF